MSALSVQNLSKAFPGTRALQDISFELEKGIVAGLIGPNGAGKTTLFSIIAGFLQPDTGVVNLFDKPLNSYESLAGTLSVLPQDARFLRNLAISEHFNWYGHLLGLSKAEATAETARVLEQVELLDAGRKQGDQLSHGMHKRMAIAQALITMPPFIMLDEPTSGLDPGNARRIRDLIRSLRGEHTVLVSSHNLDEIADVCDFVVVLDKGKLIEANSIGNFVQETAVVSFSIADDTLPDAARKALEDIEDLSDLTFKSSSRRLYCIIKPAHADDPGVLPKCVSALTTHGVNFTEMTKGSSLEERFLEIVSSGQKKN